MLGIKIKNIYYRKYFEKKNIKGTMKKKIILYILNP